MVMKILDLHQVILLHDNDSNNILILVIIDERNFLWFPVDNYEAKKKNFFFHRKFFYFTGESARFSFKNNRNLVINKNFDDGGRWRTSEGVNKSLSISIWIFSNNLRSSFNFRHAGK
jgi:hypothetical protein